MGSVLSSVGNALGDVVGGIGNVIGNVAETAMDYAPQIATALAAYYTMNPALAGEALAGDAIYTDYALGSAGAGAGSSGAGITSFLPGTGSTAGGITGISTGIEGLDNALNIVKSGYNLYNQMNQPQTISQQYNQIQPLSVQQTSSGDAVDPTKFSQGLQYATFANTPELSDITNILMNPVYKVGDALSKIGATDIADAVKKFGPTIISVIGGKLSYDDQKRINDITMNAYNKYNAGTQLKGLQYRTGQGLPSLPVYRSGQALGSQTAPTAPARTAADVVYKPVKKADGGRIGYADGSTLPNAQHIQGIMQRLKQDPQLMQRVKQLLPMAISKQGMQQSQRPQMSMTRPGMQQPQMTMAKGGLMNIMNHEMDLRAKGGFVPIGKKERADDVPARLSLNEFVMTAKAVRNAGKGSVNKGAKKMYSLMKHLEKGGNL